MDVFVLGIDADKFRSTNAAWNRLMLNDPWSVGYVSSLIETKEWTSKEEWENFYYSSGRDRRFKIGSNHSILDNDQLQISGKSQIYSLSWDQKNLNYQYGRTKEDLAHKGSILYNAVKSNGYGLTLNECIECVRFRTICETWNGIIVRENNTIDTLKRRFPNLEFVKTDGDIDHTYAVDYEVKKNGRLICGIQIKPKSYLGNAPYLRKARFANENKYQAYKEKYGVNVYNVISKTNGEIINLEVLATIASLV